MSYLGSNFARQLEIWQQFIVGYKPTSFYHYNGYRETILPCIWLRLLNSDNLKVK